MMPIATDITQLDADSLKKLIQDLQKSQRDLEARRFVEQSLTKFSAVMRWNPEDTLEVWGERLLEELAITVPCLQACIYVRQIQKNSPNEVGKINQSLKRLVSFATPSDTQTDEILYGEGLVGQAAKSARTLYFSADARLHTRTYSSLTVLYPQALLIQPLLYNGNVEGVLEVAGLQEFSVEEQEFLRLLSEMIAANLMSLRAQEEMRFLYEEAQQKSEQLQSQEEEMRQNVEELQATQEEMRRQQLEIATREARLNALINTPTDTIIVVEADYTISLANRAFLEKYPLNTVQLGITKVHEVTPEALWPVFEPYYQSAFNGTAGIQTFALLDTQQYLEIAYNPIFSIDGSVSGIAVFGKDVTEREMRNQATRESEARLNAFINSSKDIIFAIDREERLLIVNRAMRKLYEATGKEIQIGRTTLSEISTEYQMETYRPFIERAFKGEYAEAETRLPDPIAGIDQYFIETFAPIRDAGGAINVIAVTMRNVTDRITQQKTIQESEQRLNQFLDSLTDVVLAIDTNYRVTIANSVARTFFAKHEIGLEIGNTVFTDLIEPDEADIYLPNIHKAFHGEYIEADALFQHAHDAGPLYFQINYAPIKDSEGVIRAVAIIGRNISEKRTIQEQLIVQARQIEGIINSTSDYIMAFDTEGKILICNKAFRKLINVLANGLEVKSGMLFTEVLAQTQKPELITAFNEKHREVMAGMQVVSEIDVPMGNGKSIYIENTYSPILDENNQVTAVAVFARNITDKKLHELEVQKHQDLLNISQRLSRTGSFEVDLITQKITWSDMTYEIFGQPQNIELNTQTFQNMVLPEDVAYLNEQSAQALENNELSVEYRIAKPDGTIGYVHNLADIIRDDNGNPIKIRGMVRDISFRKKRDDILTQHDQEINNLLDFQKAVFDHLPVALYVKDAKDLRFVGWNRTSENYFHLTAETVMGKTDYDFFPQAEADNFIAQDRKVLAQGGTLYLPEDQITTADGSIKYIKSVKVPIYDADGNPQYLLGISQEIIQAEKEHTDIRPYERQIQFLTQNLETAQVGTFWADLEANAVQWSNTVYALLGIPSGSMDLYDDTLWAFITEEDIERFEEMYQKAYAQGEPFTSICAMETGERVPLGQMQITCRFEPDETGKIRYLCGTIQAVPVNLTVNTPEINSQIASDTNPDIEALRTQNAELQQSFAELFDLHNETKLSLETDIQHLKEQIENEKRVMLRTIEHFKSIEAQYRQQIQDKEAEIQTLRQALREM